MTTIFRADDPDGIIAAREALEAGQPVALPTETVYVVAVDPFGAGTSDRLFALLRRSRERDLSVLVADQEDALRLTTSLPAAARRLMDRCWPGPLTLVLPRDPACAADLGDDDLTIGVRMTDHPVAAVVCRSVGPLGVASAVLGDTDLATATDIADALGEAVTVIIDGGPAPGVPSTVIDATGEEPHLIREGSLPWDDAIAALKD